VRPPSRDFLQKWESGKARVLVVYADKLASGLPTVCNGVTKRVTSTPIIVGERWTDEKCEAEERAAVAAVLQATTVANGLRHGHFARMEPRPGRDVRQRCDGGVESRAVSAGLPAHRARRRRHAGVVVHLQDGGGPAPMHLRAGPGQPPSRRSRDVWRSALMLPDFRTAMLWALCFGLAAALLTASVERTRAAEARVDAAAAHKELADYRAAAALARQRAEADARAEETRPEAMKREVIDDARKEAVYSALSTPALTLVGASFSRSKAGSATTTLWRLADRIGVRPAH
jgi:hypothetical protein